MFLTKKMIHSAAKNLKELLLKVQFDQFNSKDFTLYLKNYITMYDVIIQRYEKIIYKTCQNKDILNLNLLDFGGGTGILSLLAKKCGIFSVTYCDLSEIYTRNFIILAKQTEVSIDSIYCASYHNIKEHAFYDIITNYDVLEHIDYPLSAFITLKKYLKPNGLIYMVSGANTFNPMLKIMNSIKHRDFEPFDKKNPYFLKRLNFIRTTYPDFTGKLSEYLAYKTRGLTYSKIPAYISLFLISGQNINFGINTNTCNPDTGYWQEHCFNYKNLKKALTMIYSRVQLEASYFPIALPAIEIPNRQKNKILISYYISIRLLSLILAPVLNILLFLFPGSVKLILSPAYVICAINEE